MLRHAVRLNSLSELALTKLDVLDTFDTVRVCTGYTVNGKPLSGYPDDIELLGKVTATYVDMPGWKQPLRACRLFNEMPEAARRVVELVEEHIGIPVSIVGVGPERDDCVVRT
jgi:adenylosuccinate synthase